MNYENQVLANRSHLYGKRRAATYPYETPKVHAFSEPILSHLHQVSVFTAFGQLPSERHRWRAKSQAEFANGEVEFAGLCFIVLMLFAIADFVLRV